MTAEPAPVVRYLIACEDVLVDPDRPNRVTIVGLISAIRSLDDPAYPLLYEHLCVFVQLTGARAPGDLTVIVTRADDETVVARTRTRTVDLGADPVAVKGVLFRIQDILFPTAGLYYVRLWYNDSVIGEQPILLR